MVFTVDFISVLLSDKTHRGLCPGCHHVIHFSFKLGHLFFKSFVFHQCYTLFSHEVAEVGVRNVMTQWGSRFVGRGIFANSREALAKKTGWTIEEREVPCWTKFMSGSGGGMCSVFTGSIAIVRWHTNMVTGEYVGYPE